MAKILGQNRPLQIIESALRSGRFHHAWIFSGPRGVGKFTTALEVARQLLEQGSASQAGGGMRDQRPGTRQSTTPDPYSLTPNPLTHPDLHIIRKEMALYSDNPQLRERKLMNIPLDLLRERMLGGKTGDDRMHDAPAYRTASRVGGAKLFIIDEAELLDATAQNAMLKTLEEPPPQTYIFLITSQPDRLLPTIRSRCQHVRFGPLDQASMRQWLTSHSATGDSPVAKWIEQFAGGSPGMAQLALEYGFFEWHKALEPLLADLDRGKFPSTMGATLGELVEQFAQAWVKAHGEKNTSKDAANKDGAKHLFSLLAAHVRSRLTAALERCDDPSAWLAAIDLIRDAERELDSNVNLKLLLENLVVQWVDSAGAARGEPVSIA